MQNSVEAEEKSSTAKELAIQAESLEDAIAFFKTGKKAQKLAENEKKHFRFFVFHQPNEQNGFFQMFCALSTIPDFASLAPLL